MKMLVSRPESESVFIIVPPGMLEEAVEIERRLKNAGKRVCNPFRVLDRCWKAGMLANGLEDMEEILFNRMRDCDAFYLVDGWEGSDLCRRLRDVAVMDGKMRIKVKGFYN